MINKKIINSNQINKKVLIVTGGYLTAKDEDVWIALKKQIIQRNHSKNSWLETNVKLTMAEPILASRSYFSKTKKYWSKQLNEFFNSKENFDTPELTEVVLATELNHLGVPFELMSFDDLFRDPQKSFRLLKECELVFASATFLRDLSELMPLVKRLKTDFNKLVVGGSLAGTLHKSWEGSPDIDVLAIGYGEFLVPSLVNWMNSDYKDLVPPISGRLEIKKYTKFLYSGVPSGLNLDDLKLPDWELIQKYHNKKYSMIHYESVRGCPYRCSFCNYPYLFDDQKFRTKSAKKMALDWKEYVDKLGVSYITCLDSLFTMPKKRLIEFCEELIRLKVKVKWICYARADDLCDEEVVQLMLRAGCIQVQIGVESGNQGQLERMNKRVRVEQNAQALLNCRKFGLTTVASFIVGFPGETENTINDTYNFIKESPPDFHFLCTFSTRVPGVPILQPDNVNAMGLKTDSNLYSVSPYWSHDTMSCREVGSYVRELSHRIILEELSLDASVFYQGITKYHQDLRPELLSFQAKSLASYKWKKPLFDLAQKYIQSKISL